MLGPLTEGAFDLVDAAGEWLPVFANAIGGLDDGRHVQILLAIRRATQRWQHEQGLLDARGKTEATVLSERATSELREQFIAFLGHDLRDPIVSIASGIHMLAKGTLIQRGSRVARSRCR